MPFLVIWFSLGSLVRSRELDSVIFMVSSNSRYPVILRFSLQRTGDPEGLAL